MNKISRVEFLTSSMGTKWTAYSQALLEKKFPEFGRIVIDGSSNWDPLYFVSYCENSTAEYSVLVDEDCFVFDREQLLDCLDEMDQSKDVAVLGTPDGGTFHRHLNPVACNTFFMIVRNSALKNISAEKWRKLKYQDVKENVDLSHLIFLDETRIDFSLDEPYYPFFWYLLKLNWKTKYIIPETEPSVIASSYTVNKKKIPLFLHMWWLRSWFSKEIDPYLKVSNNSRYEILEKKWLSKEFNNFEFKLILLKQKIINEKTRISRIRRKLMQRVRS